MVLVEVLELIVVPSRYLVSLGGKLCVNFPFVFEKEFRQLWILLQVTEIWMVTYFMMVRVLSLGCMSSAG